jgi:hypothetical protein
MYFPQRVCFTVELKQDLIRVHMAAETLTAEEKGQLDVFVSAAKEAEFAQVNDLLMNCHNKYQFAKTHSVYAKDWEQTKVRLENAIRTGNLPPGISANFQRALIDSMEEVMQAKLGQVQSAFSMKFNESIFNYLSKDGKARGLLGLW